MTQNWSFTKNYGHFAKQIEVSDCISKSLYQQNLRCPSPYCSFPSSHCYLCSNSFPHCYLCSFLTCFSCSYSFPHFFSCPVLTARVAEYKVSDNQKSKNHAIFHSYFFFFCSCYLGKGTIKNPSIFDY